jgi:anti-sigma regulatory factor (Ser/Thr protein kinase)
LFEYASAGHPPILLVPPGGEARWLDEAQSPPLYGDDGRQRQESKLVLEPSSLLVLYSDGLVERRGDLLSDRLDQLKHVGATLIDQSPSDICDQLVAALGVETSRQDDVAVLVVRFNPLAGGGFHLVFPAEPGELRELRTSLRDWLDTREVAAATQTALIVAIGEACSNAIEHAYTDLAPGEIKVEIEEVEENMLAVTVRDHGRFLARSKPVANRGRGTALMRELTVDFTRDSTPSGTTVSFRLPIADRPSG